jgi:hypothetical protein
MGFVFDCVCSPDRRSLEERKAVDIERTHVFVYVLPVRRQGRYQVLPTLLQPEVVKRLKVNFERRLVLPDGCVQ